MGQKKLFIMIVFAGVVILLSLWSTNINCSSSRSNNNAVEVQMNVPQKPATTYKMFSVSHPLNFSTDDFFSMDLLKHPEETNKLSAMLTTRPEVINEAQRIHMDIFKSLLGSYKYAMLFNYSPSENKGDSAIAVGEVILLRKLNIEIVFSCATGACTKQKCKEAHKIAMTYTNKDLVILFHGGGNVIGWPAADNWRANEISLFMDFHIVMFPQSILYIEPQSHIDFCKKLYASHERLTFVWRDKESFKLGKSLFPKVQSLLSPDMAYQIGYVARYMLPTHDVIWIKRTDKESPSYSIPSTQFGYRIHVSDWLNWKTPAGTSPMENVFLMTTNGMTFLQRGRVVITDRLHGHILSTLLGIPHVYIDNKQRKISNYHNTWTASVENIMLANSSTDALIQAKILLNKLNNDLPSIKGFYTHTG